MVSDGDVLTTFAPAIDVPPDSIPTGNLWISLSRIDRGTASVRTIACLHDRANGMIEVWGDDDGVVVPFVEVDGIRQTLDVLTWTREHHWLPRVTARCGGGELEASYCAPTGERGASFRLRHRRLDGGSTPARCTVGWLVRWDRTALTQLRSTPVDVAVESERDGWTRSHVLAGSAGLPLLALGVQPGGDAGLLPPDGTASCVVAATRDLVAGDELVADLYLSLAPERDGAATGALHLRRRGFDDLWASTATWLDDHRLPVSDLDPRAGLAERVNENAFFNYFFAQGDCLDSGRSVLVTSRSSDYYVSAAFWSRDAYQWTFPGLLLVDPGRARAVLLASIETAGDRIADHALYINGTSLYPGFELDQAAAPILAVHLYVVSTDDLSVLSEPAVRRLCDRFVGTIAPWRNDQLGLYGTFLLPTDDPTRHPYTTTNNALVRAAFESLARLAPLREAHPSGAHVQDFRALAAELEQAITDRLVREDQGGTSWAWACDDDGRLEQRDEPPLSLSTLPFWGLCESDDPRQAGTRRWLAADNPYRYEGLFPGAGSAHFPFPSGFDLASRLLVSHEGTDPLQELVETAMDHGLGCESWDPGTGRVRTGAAMASMAGLLAWTTWSRLTGRAQWHQPLRRQPLGPA